MFAAIEGCQSSCDGRHWKREIPDYTWDQSRTNSVTCMTFLFLETRITDTTFSGQDTVTHVS